MFSWVKEQIMNICNSNTNSNTNSREEFKKDYFKEKPIEKEVKMKSQHKKEEKPDEVFDHIIDLIKKGHNIFVTGGAGVGKSYTLAKIKEVYKRKLYITSTTGISAINVGGQTIHSWAGIGIANRPIEDIVKRISRKPTLVKTLVSCKMLAIDEISMLDNITFDYINQVLKIIREDERPFGGIQVIIFGDFFQLPPACLNKNNRDFCFNSQTWKELDLKTVLLTEVKRQSEKALSNALNNIRIDQTTENDLELFYNRNFDFSYEPPRDILQLFSTNASADSYNIKCLDEIEEEPKTYDSIDFMYSYNSSKKPIQTNIKDMLDQPDSYQFELEEFKKFNDDCKAPQALTLKNGCRVMLLKNVDLGKGLANGSCGTVKELKDDKVRILFDNKVTIDLEPEDFEYLKEGKTRIKRTQFPVRLAYGITVHKSQGMTFDNLVVNFNRIFDYGQAYVALSRTRTLDGLIIKGFDPNKIIANPKVIAFYKKIEEETKEKTKELAKIEEIQKSA